MGWYSHLNQMMNTIMRKSVAMMQYISALFCRARRLGVAPRPGRADGEPRPLRGFVRAALEERMVAARHVHQRVAELRDV